MKVAQIEFTGRRIRILDIRALSRGCGMIRRRGRLGENELCALKTI
jgi:hypothetical protein